MLVVAANWAISDGTLVSHPRRRQEEWLAAVHRAAIRAGWCRDGCYQPIAGLDIVLAGDTFDGLTTAAWSADVRPWQAGRRAAELRRTTALRAIRRGRTLLAGLRGWCRTGLPVPAVDGRGRPRPRLDTPVPVRVTLLTGDRDRWLAEGAACAERYGFTVGSSWTDGTVSVGHGDLLDPFCGDSDERADVTGDRGSPATCRRPSLAETIAAGLVSRFGGGLAALPGVWPAGRSLVGQLASGLPAEMPGVVEAWLREAVQREQVSSSTAAAISRCWHAAVAMWLKEARGIEPRCGHVVDGVDVVARWLGRDGAGRPSVRYGFAPLDDEVPRRREADVVAVDMAYPLTARPAVILVGHRMAMGAGAQGMSGEGSGLLCLADLRTGPGPVTVCCHRDRHVLRVEPLDEPDTASPTAITLPPALARDHGGLIIDAA